MIVAMGKAPGKKSFRRLTSHEVRRLSYSTSAGTGSMSTLASRLEDVPVLIAKTQRNVRMTAFI
jgi:hypothetical protein